MGVIRMEKYLAAVPCRNLLSIHEYIFTCSKLSGFCSILQEVIPKRLLILQSDCTVLMGAAEEIRLDFRPSSLCQTKDQLVLALRVPSWKM